MFPTDKSFQDMTISQKLWCYVNIKKDKEEMLDLYSFGKENVGEDKKTSNKEIILEVSDEDFEKQIKTRS